MAESNVEGLHRSAYRVVGNYLLTLWLTAYITLFMKLIRFKYVQFGNTSLEMDTVRCPNYLTSP